MLSHIQIFKPKAATFDKVFKKAKKLGYKQEPTPEQDNCGHPNDFLDVVDRLPGILDGTKEETCSHLTCIVMANKGHEAPEIEMNELKQREDFGHMSDHQGDNCVVHGSATKNEQCGTRKGRKEAKAETYSRQAKNVPHSK